MEKFIKKSTDELIEQKLPNRQSYRLRKYCFIFASIQFFAYLPEFDSSELNEWMEMADGKESKWPYWAEEWVSQPVLIHWLSKNAKWIKGNVLEIGAGIGLLKKAIRLMARLNPISFDINWESSRILVKNLSGDSKEKPGAFYLPNHLCADWSHLPFKTQFETLIASDVCYDQEAADSFFKLVQSLRNKNLKVIFSDPGRRPLMPLIEKFRASEWDAYSESVTIQDQKNTIYKANIILLTAKT